MTSHDRQTPDRVADAVHILEQCIQEHFTIWIVIDCVQLEFIESKEEIFLENVAFYVYRKSTSPKKDFDEDFFGKKV